MTTQIAALSASLNAAGIKGSVWREQRIYLSGHGKDIKAYIIFDDPLRDAADCTGPMGLYAGCALRVFSDANQSRKWLVNRAKQVKHNIMAEMVLLGIAPGPICEDWQDIIL